MTSHYNITLYLTVKSRDDSSIGISLKSEFILRVEPHDDLTLKIRNEVFKIKNVVYDLESETYTATLNPHLSVSGELYESTVEEYLKNGWVVLIPGETEKSPKMTVSELVIAIQEVRSCTAPELFEDKVCDLIIESGISDYNISQAFYFAIVPYKEGESIKKKLDLRRRTDIPTEPEEKEVDVLTNKIREAMELSPHDCETIEYFFNNEFENLSTLNNFLKCRSDVDERSFKLGFVACIVTCIE